MATTEVRISPEDVKQAASQVKERIPEPTAVVIFGASGDLTKRKLLPALFHLEQAGLLPEHFRIVGVARRDLGKSFADDMRQGILDFGGVDKGDAKLDEFIGKVGYQAMDFDNDQGYQALKSLLEQYDRDYGTRGNRLFYLATAPDYFADIVHRLGTHGMAKPEVGTVRIIIEKPFGHDLESAKELNDDVDTVFSESQIFRIDHYLGKETVQNILVFRFANGIFEPIWNRNFVDHVQITAAENIGIEGRGPFYEKAGALRDVVQNHMMELLSFVTMEPPASFAADAVRREKIDQADQYLRLRAWAVRPGLRGRPDGKGLSRGGPGRSKIADRNLRGSAPGDRQLAVGGGSFLSARGQAAGQPGDGDHRAIQATANVTFWRAHAWTVHRHTAEHDHHADPAGRGDLAALWRQDAGTADGGLSGDHGLQLHAGFRGVVSQRIRTAAAGCDAGRCDAVCSS
jgi:hypothetical protein